MAVGAIFAAVSIATSVMQLFGPKGYSLGNLLAIQTEMLKNISQQIIAIQNGIEEILKQLEDIQRKLDQLPENLATEIYNRNLQGVMFTYNDLMKGYIEERDKFGIPQARSYYIPRINEEILRPIQSVRNTLITFKNPLHAPILSLALYAEIHSMILTDTPHSAIKSALERYEEYFSDLLEIANPRSLPNTLVAFRAKKIQCDNQCNELIYKDFCLSLLERTGTSLRGITSFRNFRFDQTVIYDEEEMNKINALLEIEALQKADLACKLTINPEPLISDQVSWGHGMADGYDYSYTIPPDRPDLMRGTIADMEFTASSVPLCTNVALI